MKRGHYALIRAVDDVVHGVVVCLHDAGVVVRAERGVGAEPGGDQ